MSYAIYKTADGSRHFIKNTYENAAGQPFALGANYTTAAGALYQVFFSNVSIGTLPLGEVFIATDNRVFTAT